MAAAVDSVAAVVVVPVESAIAGKRLTCSNRRKGAMKAWHPFFLMQRLPSAMCHAMGGVYADSGATTGDGAGRRGTNDLLHAEK